MRHSRATGQGVRVLALTLISGLALSGCSSLGDHNDVLLFGTDTKFALDVSADATSGGTPSVTLGYKRKEAVWMPLLTNGVCRAKAPPSYCLSASRKEADTSRYIGSAGTGASERKDAYSVFASFGANLKGDSSTSAHATVGLAQFFATGIAAQKLAENPQAANVLAVQPEATGQAIALAATGDPALISAVTRKHDALKSLATRLYRCAGVSSLKAKLEGQLDAEGFSKEDAAKITGVQDELAAQRMIDGFDETKISTAVAAACV